MELWNAYTRDGELTDKVLVRGEPVPEGLFHLACEVLVRHTDGDYLCMRRSVKKSDFGGMLEATAGGAAQIGEGKLDCIRRELREECGIEAGELEQIGYLVDERNRVIVASYFTTVDCAKDSVTLQEGETEGYLWMGEEEFISFVGSGEMIPTQRARLDGYFRRIGYVK